MDFLIILTLATIIDVTLGDPPNIVHPVAWMGKVISLLERSGLKLNTSSQFIYGILMTLFITVLCTVPIYFLISYLQDLNNIIYIIVSGILLKMTFSIRGLRHTALKINTLLLENKLDNSRFELRALVSRDTKTLNESQMASAAAESVAEGTCDSLVAPLFFFLLLGVPGAIGYRVVNTLDSMIGYHGKYEYLGKFAAKLDDVLNFIPARLAALVLILAAALKRTGYNAWKTALDEHKKTESPNAGWPMAAMAGTLNVRLEKPGYYVLGERNNVPNIKTIKSSVTIFSLAAAAWLLICFLAGGICIAIIS